MEDFFLDCISFSPKGGYEICDFCSSPNVQWVYSARDASITGDIDLLEGERVTLSSEGDWAACEICSKLIEEEEREALLLRSINSAPNTPNLSTEIIKQVTRQIHSMFWLNRSGERVKFNKIKKR